MFIPPIVQRHLDSVQKGLNIEPQLTKINHHLFRITVARPDNRVFCTVDYRFNVTGKRWEWADSKLLVDGEPKELMRTHQDFFRLYHNPESNGMPKAGPLPPIPALPTEQQLSKEHEDIALARLRLIDPDATLTLLEGSVMEFRTNRGVMRWMVSAKGLTLLAAQLDGYDYTQRFQKGGLEELFQFFARTYGVELPPLSKSNAQKLNTSLTSTPPPNTMANSVRVRKQAVIRT